MSVTGLGLEWVRRKHPELRPEHPGHRRQRFCRAADAEQLAHAAALRESSLQKREAAAGWCCRLVPPVAAAAHPELRRELQAGSHRLHSHLHNRSAATPPTCVTTAPKARRTGERFRRRGRFTQPIGAAAQQSQRPAAATPRTRCGRLAQLTGASAATSAA